MQRACRNCVIQRLNQTLQPPPKFATIHGSFADQLPRAAGATVRLIAEGANRFSPGSKRRRSSHPDGGHTLLEARLHTRFSAT